MSKYSAYKILVGLLAVATAFAAANSTLFPGINREVK
jgi:hypothetical protein